MNTIPTEWLRQKGTAEDFERASLEQKAAAFSLPFEVVAQKFGARPFAQMTNRWREFVGTKDEQDELWFFRSPEETFARNCGCQGYALVRDGVIRSTFVILRT
jgi:hypothetical protein